MGPDKQKWHKHKSDSPQWSQRFALEQASQDEFLRSKNQRNIRMILWTLTGIAACVAAYWIKLRH